MTYLQARKRPYHRLARIIAGVIGFVVVVLTVLQLSIPHFFPSLFTAIARPFWRIEFSLGNGALKSPEVLLNQNETLLRQLSDAQVRLDTIHAIESENEELKTLLGRNSASTETIGTSTSSRAKVSTKNLETRILAAVLKRPPASHYDELIIDIGHDYNVSTSSLIYATGDILLGRVIDVVGKTAKVKLFSSPGEKYDVLVGSKHIAATAAGRGGGQYEAQVSRDTDIKEGDFVLNSSLNDKPFGIVSAVVLDPTLPFKTVLFAPSVNLYELRWVLVKNF